MASSNTMRTRTTTNLDVHNCRYERFLTCSKSVLHSNSIKMAERMTEPKRTSSAIVCRSHPGMGPVISDHYLNIHANKDMVDRRSALLLSSAALIVASLGAPTVPPSRAANDDPSLSSNQFIEYSSLSQGYTLMRPSSYEQVEKAGADVLFQNPDRKSTSIGVTVLPVRIPSLDQFGTLNEVGEKLLSTEKAKESTLSVVMLNQGERTTDFGTVYDFLYELESTRGRKKIINCVTIVNNKLYIVNGTVGCGKNTVCDAPAENDVAVLQQAAQSLKIN